MSNIPGNTTTSTILSPNASARNTLTFVGDSDWYKIELKQGLSYGLKVSGDGGAQSLPDPDLFLYDNLGNELDGGKNYSTTSESINFTAARTGLHFAGVSDTSDTGNYVLSLIGSDTIRNDLSLIHI